MSYTSSPFLFYFLPATLAVYYLLGVFTRARLLKNWLLLLASGVFLFWLQPLYLPLIAALCGVYWRLGLAIKAALWEGKPTKAYLRTGYIVGVGLFLGFQLLGTLAGYGVPVLGLDSLLSRDLLVTAGLGIFTLRAIGYVADVHARRVVAEKSFTSLALYFCFFPQIIIGPLQTYKEFAPQLAQPFHAERLYAGACRFAVGLGKKILLAGNLAVISDRVFSLSATSDSLTKVPVSLAWLGLLCFVLQMYYELSAYSDMAIGMSNMFGFTAPENFRYPYMAGSMTEFWNRWLITIKSWFDRYVARPLNSVRYENKDQMLINTFFAFLAMGIWQKASIGMLVWAFLQVLCIAFEQVITYDKRRIPGVIKHAYVALALLLSAALVRYTSFYQVFLFFRNLVHLNHNGFASPLALALLKEYGVVLAAALVFLFPVAPRLREKMEASSGRGLRAVAGGVYVLLLAGVVLLCLLFIARGLYVPNGYFSL